MASLENVPAGLLPPGATTVLDQNSNIWPSIVAVSVITLVTLVFSIALRLHTKIFVQKTPDGRTVREASHRLLHSTHSNSTDLSLFASALLIAWTVLFDVSCHLGISKHQWNVRSSHMQQILSNLNIADILLGPMLGAAKVALVLQMRRHFKTQGKPRRAFDQYTYATVVVVVGYYFAAIFIAAFQYMPRRGIWDPTAHARCVNTPRAVFTEGSFALLTDVMVFALFGWLVAVLGARRLGGVALVGSITVIALLGIASSSASFYYRMPFVYHEMDLTYRIGLLQMWAKVEYTTVIVSGCMPAVGMHLVGCRKERQTT